MRYLQYREEFLNKELNLNEDQIQEQIKSSVMINEAFENDIRWGDSLIGRLINSAIRVAKAQIKSTQINKLLTLFKHELDALLMEFLTDENKKNANTALIYTLLADIHKTVHLKENEELPSGEQATVSNKAKYLVDDPGQIDKCIEKINKIGEFETPQGETKEDLIKKLEKLKELLTPLIEDKDSEGKGEGEGSGTGEGSSEGEGSGKSPFFTFFVNTMNLFKAIISLDGNISGKFPTTKLAPSNLKVGGEYFYIDGGKKQVVKIINLEHPVIIGPDGKWLSKDDKVQSQKIKPKVFVSVKNKKGQYDPTGIEVDPKKIQPMKNESNLFYEMESLPIFEEVAEIQSGETHATAAWRKVTKYWSQSGISKQVPKMKEILEKSKSGEKLDKKILTAIGKQVIINEQMWKDGKPMPFEELIKEEAGALPSEYQEIPKAITLVARVILAFKEDMGLLGQLAGSPNNTGDTKKSIELFIKSYDEMKGTYPKLKQAQGKTEEPKKEGENKEEPKKESFQIRKFSSFISINEADEDDTDEVDEGEGEGEESIEDETQGNLNEFEDKVTQAWTKAGFKKGEEKAWYKKYDQKAKDNLANSVDEDLNKEKTIDPDKSITDHIIKIVNIFGRAYKNYAVDEIPSGRKNGFISQKTFRQYEFIGKGDNRPQVKEEAGPGYGPWAYRQTLDKWDKGVTDILEDGKYRRILANTNFKSTAEKETNTGMKEPGSGKTLFSFINDMLGWDGKYTNFKEKRHKILTEYFGGTISDDKGLDKTPENTNPKSVSDDDMEEKVLKWMNHSQAGITSTINPTNIDTYQNMFIRLKYNDDKGQKDRPIIMFIDSWDTTKKIMWVRFELHEKEDQMIFRYFPEPWKKQNLINKEKTSVYLGKLTLDNTHNIGEGTKNLSIEYIGISKEAPKEKNNLVIKQITKFEVLSTIVKTKKGNFPQPAKPNLDGEKIKKQTWEYPGPMKEAKKKLL
jgi:hypothetical protein